MNISAPTWFIAKLKKTVGNGNVSKFMVAAAEEKLQREERRKALEEVRQFGPTFTEIADASKHIHDLRAVDNERDTRLASL
jgi:hypothetical protein